MGKAGDRIRELRQRQHLTLDDVARHLGIGRQAVYKYEQGTVTNIPLENLEKMAALFGVSPDYLAGWTDDDPAGPPPDTPQTPEARIVSGSLDRMPPEARQRALQLLSLAFSEYFKEDPDHDA